MNSIALSVSTSPLSFTVHDLNIGCLPLPCLRPLSQQQLFAQMRLACGDLRLLVLYRRLTHTEAGNFVVSLRPTLFCGLLPPWF